LPTIETFEVHQPIVKIARMDTTKDLEWFLKELDNPNGQFERQENKYDRHTLYLSDDGQRIHYKEYKSAYGNSVDEYIRTYLSIGSYVMWNQIKEFTVRDRKEIPEELTKLIIVPVAVKVKKVS
jgi:hypothetical protein